MFQLLGGLSMTNMAGVVYPKWEILTVRIPSLVFFIVWNSLLSGCEKIRVVFQAALLLCPVVGRHEEQEEGPVLDQILRFCVHISIRD